MKDLSDFELEQTRPTSIREIVLDEMASTTYKGKTNPKPESIDDLLQKIYAHIERQALEVFKSNEPWALKAWSYSNILKEAVVEEHNQLLRQRVIQEADQPMVEELISPIVDWQNAQPFDPIAHFLKRLKRKSKRTRYSYIQTVARFVAKEGRKKYYTDEDVEDFQTYMMERYPNQNSYYQECRKLLIFLRSLPNANKGRELPLEMPRPPKKKDMYRPVASLEEIETLIWACVLDNIRPSMVIRLIGATVYGRRREELTEFTVNLDGADSSIKFPVVKRGEESPHPLPQSLVPLFSIPVRRMSGNSLQRRLRTICRKAQVHLPDGAGYHWIRRRVSTVVRRSCGSDIDAYRFMRWAEPRELEMLAWYDETPYKQTDEEILQKHPIVRIWEQACPYILKFNRHYQKLIDNIY